MQESDLTRRQRDVLRCLRAVAADSADPPTLDELCAALGLASRGSLHKHVQALVDAGLVEPLGQKQRGVRLRAFPDAAGRVLPMLGTIAAGRPIEAVTGQASVEVPAGLRSRRPCYVLEVRGDSMRDDGILDGDRVIVEQCERADDGAVVVALIDGTDATLKRIEQRRGEVMLHPANATMRPMRYAPERVVIQGVVVGLMRSYR